MFLYCDYNFIPLRGENSIMLFSLCNIYNKKSTATYIYNVHSFKCSRLLYLELSLYICRSIFFLVPWRSQDGESPLCKKINNARYANFRHFPYKGIKYQRISTELIRTYIYFFYAYAYFIAYFFSMFFKMISKAIPK